MFLNEIIIFIYICMLHNNYKTKSEE